MKYFYYLVVIFLFLFSCNYSDKLETNVIQLSGKWDGKLIYTYQINNPADSLASLTEYLASSELVEEIEIDSMVFNFYGDTLKINSQGKTVYYHYELDSLEKSELILTKNGEMTLINILKFTGDTLILNQDGIRISEEDDFKRFAGSYFILTKNKVHNKM